MLMFANRNMYMCEDYNSPQSPYWSLKTLIMISLSQSSEFWAAEEEPYPSSPFPPQLVRAPRQIISNHPTGNHHFCLSPAQFVSWPLKATQAKYSKFEYSSTFAFSVPTGPLIQQIAPDCTLALSRDGAETWAVKWKCSEPEFPTIYLKSPEGSSSVTAASVRWYPWGDRQVKVKTILIPPTDRWPDWHIRVHRIRANKPIQSLHTVEGGFASPSRRLRDGTKLPGISGVDKEMELGTSEGVLETGDSALILSSAGASGISPTTSDHSSRNLLGSTQVLKPDANTNIAHQRTIIPIVTRDVTRDIQAGDEIVLMTRVFALSGAGAGKKVQMNLAERWADRPIILTGKEDGIGSPVNCIFVDI